MGGGSPVRFSDYNEPPPVSRKRNTMTRKLFVCALVIVTLPAWGKDKGPDPMPINEDGAYEYSGAFEVYGASAGELYSRAKAWVANNYRSAQDVVQLDDKDAHRLIVKGLTTTSWLLEIGYVRHTLTIETKDGKYRYSLGGFVLSTDGGIGRDISPATKPKLIGKRGVIRRTHAEIAALITSLQIAMEVEADDDW